MKTEYDFSKATRGKFYRGDVRLKLPVYLDDDVAEFVQAYAERRQADVQTIVNQLIRRSTEMTPAQPAP